MDKEPTKIRLILKLTSAVLTPEELSARLGVDFDTCHRIGEPRGKTAKFWTENWWKISARLARLNVFVDFDLYCGDLSGTKN